MRSKKKFQGLKTENGKKTKNPFESGTWLKLKQLFPKIEYESDKYPYTTTHKYIPDFKVTREDGSVFYIETKGNGRSWTPQVRQKMLMIKEQHPELDIRFLFYSDGPFGTKRKDGSRMTQSQWAEKYNFIYAIRDMPDDWLRS